MTVSSLIRFVSLALTVVIVASFGLFVWDELGSASKQQATIAQEDNPTLAVNVRDAHGRLKADEKTKLRIDIDRVNDAITSPGEAIGKNASNSNEWAMRLGAFIFGILVFLLGLRLLASWVEMRGPVQGNAVQHTSRETRYTPGAH